MISKYDGYSLSWAHGRLKYAEEALDHIEEHGLLPVDGRPFTLKTDLPAICYVLGDKADEHPTIRRVREALKIWGL